MKTLLINSSDYAGGAARAAYRLHDGLRQQGVDSWMLTQSRMLSDPTIVAPKTRLAQGIARSRLTFDALPLKRYPQHPKGMFSVQWLPDRLRSQIQQLRPDLINLHWINEAFMQIETIRQLKLPIVWSLHDMWAFTGGCHYTGGCERYQKQCGSCPQLQSQQSQDLSHRIWRRKAQAWQQRNLTIVALSKWMADCAQKSALFQNLRIEHIPNGLNPELYRPLDRAAVRHILRLPQDKPLALFGAMSATDDRRKGFHLLQPALQSLSQNGWHDRLELVVCGANRPENPPDFGLPVHYLGSFQDDLSLALLYAAADVFILPSTQENLSNMVMEALACGTPTVAFAIGGNGDMIEHQRNGYLAQAEDITDLAQGIAWVLEHPERQAKLGDRARQKILQEFTQTRQAQRYQALFSDILHPRPPNRQHHSQSSMLNSHSPEVIS
jgi:glycosyltransferase involved in cell wall biosynthesis